MNWRWIVANVFLCVVALVILIVAPLPKNHQSQSADDTRHSDNSQSNPDATKSSLNPQNPNSPNNNPTPCNQQPASDGDHYVFWGMVINTFLGIATALIAIFSIVQGIATKRSADALVASERAWIDGELTRVAAAGAIRHQVKVTNRGKTPAHVISCEVNYACCLEGDYIDKVKSVAGSFWRVDALIGAEKEEKLGDVIDLPTLLQGCKRWGICRVSILYADMIAPKETREMYFVVRYDNLLGTTERITFDDSYT